MWREYFYFVLYNANVLKMKSSALFLEKRISFYTCGSIPLISLILAIDILQDTYSLLSETT